jgi:RNA polymerase sigma factor (sigma-70 family)
MLNRQASVAIQTKTLPPQATVWLGDLNDSQLLERFVRLRDGKAFATLMERHGPMVLGVCRRILQAPQDIEDAFQGTFLVLVRKADAIGRRELLGNWLYGVAYRIAIRARANAAKRRAHERRSAAAVATEPTHELIWRDLRPVLDDEVSRLPEKYRVPIVLCYLEGKTLEETARYLGCPKGTIATRLTRARERLRRRLRRRGVVVPILVLSALLSEETASAAVPATLAASTSKASLVAIDCTSSVGRDVFSWHIASWKENLLQALARTRLKPVLALLFALLMVGFATVVITRETLAEMQFGRRGTAIRSKPGPATSPAGPKGALPEDPDCAP